MSKLARKPIAIPKGVEVEVSGQEITVKGSKGKLSWRVHDLVEIVVEDGAVRVRPKTVSKEGKMQTGTTWALIRNMVTGVSEGFERRLLLVGVGYRAQLQGKKLVLALGYSHPVEYPIPEDIQIEVPSATEIVVRGIDKQRVGQVAAEIRALRPPEPYKGKGIRYADEEVLRKETKKK